MILANVATHPGIRIDTCIQSGGTDTPPSIVSVLPAASASLDTYLFFSSNNIIESPTAGFQIVSPCTGTAPTFVNAERLIFGGTFTETSTSPIDPRACGPAAYSNVDPVPNGDAFFSATTYKGAFGSVNWLDGWSLFNQPNRPGFVSGSFTCPTGAATDEVALCGTLSADTFLLAGSPLYVLTCQVFVPSGIVLRIAQGVTIYASPVAAGGGGASALIIEKGGSLLAEGSAAAPITFTAFNPTVSSSVTTGACDGDLIHVNDGTGGKFGNGILTLSGSSSYTGATAVNGGRLLVNGQLGNTAVAVNASGLLGGSGTILGDVTVGLSGTLSPGNSPGVLTVGSLSLLAGSTTLMEITGTSASLYDQIVGVGSGGLTYGGTLDLVMSGSYANGTTFNLFSNFSSPSIGDFAAVGLDATGSEYAGLTFTGTAGVWTSTETANGQRLIFSTGTGDLVVVPEPSTYAMALAGLACGGWQMFRRRRLRQAPTLAA